jgi:hypothetical protein
MQPDLIEMVNADSERMAKARERNRALFPQIAAWTDTLNAAGLGPVRVIFAEENGCRVGKLDE